MDVGVKIGGEGYEAHSSFPCGGPSLVTLGQVWVGYPKLEGWVVALQKGVGYLWGPSLVGNGGRNLLGLRGG